ncbi:hypothetical protein DFP73DRAFT_532452 [Morchella snyderi]|nr:hypothetical protein DFP73DRAFT_532452 [Morchella snyderi]
MDIAFGVIPMVVLVYKGYRTVKEFVSSYKTFEEDSRSVKRKINVLEAIFTQTLDHSFEGVVEESVRRAMLQDPESEHWSKPELNERFEEKLGPQMPVVKGAILSCEMTLKKLGETQRNSQARLDVATDAALFAAGDPGSQKNGNSASIASSIICLRFRSNHNSHKRLVGCIKGIIAEMKALCGELHEEITQLRVLLKLVQKSQLRLERSAPTREGPSQPDDPVLDAAKACIVNAATGRLHPIVSNNLLCDCHLVHLCLDGQVAEVVKCAKGTSERPSVITEAPTQFSFRLSASPDDAGSIGTPPPGPITVVFLSETTASPGPAPAGGTGSVKICEEFSSKIEGHERRFHDSQGGGGFRLRLTPGSRSCQPLSLHEVISHRLSDLTTLDRFLIAINLARSLIHLYSSPWVRNWGINTIYFFEGQEEANSCIGYWKPYLSLQRDNDNISYLADNNRDIYRLGYLLLQLGCCSTKDIPAGQEDVALMLCFERICQNMGPAYRNFVRECLQSWGANRSMNLLQDEHLKLFLSHVTGLQGAMAQLINPS